MKPNRTPSFSGFKPASKISSKAKQKNLLKDTEHEIILRKALWHMGLRFRKNVNTLPGKPDIVFTRARLIIFCDGDFWHGRNWNQLRQSLKKRANAKYWSAKIAYNIKRDKNNTKILEADGWHVIRLWEGDIKRDPLATAEYVKASVNAQKNRPRVQGSL